jgi:hypothetical protein
MVAEQWEVTSGDVMEMTGSVCGGSIGGELQ